MSAISLEQEAHPPETGEKQDLESNLLGPDSYESRLPSDVVNTVVIHTLERQREEAVQLGASTEKFDAAITQAKGCMSDCAIPDEVVDAAWKQGDELFLGANGRVFARFDELTRAGYAEETAKRALVVEYNSALRKEMYEKLDAAEVLVNAAAAAKDRTVVYMYSAHGIQTRRGKDSVAKPSSGGFETFGSGSTNQGADTALLEKGLPDDPSSEFVQFLPTSSIGGESPSTVRNPNTGKEEPAVAVRYKFRYSVADAQLATAAGHYELPPYTEETGRGQNFVEVASILPKSTADDLRIVLSQKPEAIRILVEDLVQHEGGLTKSDWSEPRPGAIGRVTQRPPYEQLPSWWSVEVFDSQE